MAHYPPQSKLDKVYRLQFLRSVQVVVKTASQISCEVICGGEFNESVGIDLNYSVTFRVHSSSAITSIIEWQACTDVQCSSPRKGDGATVLKIRLPLSSAFYSIVISSNQHRDDTIILPIISEVFEALGAEDYQRYVTKTGPFIPRHLGCYRSFALIDKEVLVKEEYGVTLGSHIYDSSIVLMRYIERNIAELVKVDAAAERPVILDLGAGCGMVGLCIAALLSGTQSNSSRPAESVATESATADWPSSTVPCTVYITDRNQQKGLIEHNISINPAITAGSVRVHYEDLDWADAAQLDHVVEITKGAVSLVVAGDVFYDREVAKLFFNVASALSAHNSGVRVLVAQKLRLNCDNQAVALISEEEIRSECGFVNVSKVCHEAEVILWLLSM